MRLNKITLFFSALLLVITSCQGKLDVKPVVYTNVRTDTCQADPLNYYHYSLPAGKQEMLPLIIVLDPHGNGLLGVGKIKAAASRINCFIAGSDLVRNNYPDYLQAISLMIADIESKYPIDKNQIFIAGFSGGARMAFEYARAQSVKGVLMCSAAPQVNSPDALPCPVYLISGTKDFNFTETWADPSSGNSYSRFFSDYFRGIHEWPPKDFIQAGLMFLINKSLPLPSGVCKTESASLLQKTDSLYNAHDYLLALKAAQKALLFSKSNQAEEWIKKISQSTEGKNQFNEISRFLSLEYRLTQEYAKAMMQKDSTWWFNEISVIENHISQSSGNEKDHLERIRGFLGIVFYSQISNLLGSQPKNPQIIHMLAAYRKLEPDNADVYYYFALYNFKSGNTQKSRYFLNLSRSKGFSDQGRLKRDFPVEIQ